MPRSRRSRGRPGLWRTLNYLAFLPLASRAPDYARLLASLVRDPRVPAARKAGLAAAAGYVLSPIDLVPEWLPVLGALDDVVVVVLALELFLAGLPDGLVDEKLHELGIDSAGFHQDRAAVRRFIPPPLRHATRVAPHVSSAARRAGDYARRSGLDRRLRASIPGPGTVSRDSLSTEDLPA
jgi:uncharacterized membrane protein YkvA (DUF1232 family)